MELPAGVMGAGDQINLESTPKSENMSNGSKKRQDKKNIIFPFDTSIIMTIIKEIVVRE